MILSIFIFFLLLANYLYFLIKIRLGLKNIKLVQSKNKIEEFVSVIVPFRNEEKNIRASLESLVNQKYEKNKYEIIYVDDNSDDNSLDILKNSITGNNIKIVQSTASLKNKAHKKLALKKAIDEAKGEIIITTDADCTHGKKWLKTMVETFDENTGFVSGPVEFISDGTFFSELQKLEFSSLILVGAGLIGIKQPVICNAANLGFRKSVFNLVGGYEDNLNLSSGDDEFLMQKISYNTNYNVKFCYEGNALSFTKPNNSLTEFYQQRKRWASKGFFYIKKSTVINLILIFLFYLGLFLQFILGFVVNPVYFVSLLVSLILKIIFEYQIVITESEKLFTKISRKYFFIAELFHVPYILTASVSGIFGNYKWKGRKVKR